MSKNRYDRIAGALYGFAIGDAMGATTEFMSKEEIAKKYGKVDSIQGGGWLNLEAGQVTDDTQMTLCIIDALMSKPLTKVQRQIARNFVRWYNSNPVDIGVTCAHGIQYLAMNKIPSHNSEALGNGSLMRALPFALMGNSFVDDNVVQGIMTHNNGLCSGFIRVYHNLIATMIEDGIEPTLEIEGLMEPTGHVVNTFTNATYWSNRETFEECIIGAVNHGGDSDTIAAIAGSIAGAKFGMEAIPKGWIGALCPDVKLELDSFAEFVAKSF